ncbi:MAG: FAD:protein FMN transferase [Sedimentisphaerales bacterium]|nr:FAD:protein FMN transferase [Sedimentisphaerales bacterium]
MNTKIRSITILVFILFLITVLFFSAIRKQPVEFESGYRLVMGTFARVIIVASNPDSAKKAATAAFAAIEKVDDLMSDYKDDSEIGIVNKEAFQRDVQVSESTFEVIQRSIEFSKLTDGDFDITIGPLSALFRKEKETQIASTQEEINQAKEKVGYEKLILDETNRTVRFSIEGMKLDLGGIAKGYGIDKAIEAIQKTDALGAIVDVGGDCRCFGIPPEGRKSWAVGIQNPNINDDSSENELVMKLKATDRAITTSGDYQQFVIIEGKKQSHIINRKTGSGAEGLSSVTIITGNATDADALATAISVMGTKKGIELIEKLKDTEVILIPSGQTEFIMTSGADKYIK